MTTGKTQTVVSINRYFYYYSHRNVETSNVAGFSKTAERITMKLSDIMEDGSLGVNIDDATTSYIIGTSHIFSPNFLIPNFFPKKDFPPKFFIPKNFFPNFFSPKFLSPNFFPPNFVSLNFSPKFLTGTFLPTLCSPLLKIAITLYALRMTLSCVVCVGAIILSSRNQG